MPSAACAPSGPPAPPTGEKVDEFFQLLEQQVPFPAAELETAYSSGPPPTLERPGRDAERRVAMGHAVRTVPRQFSDTQCTVPAAAQLRRVLPHLDIFPPPGLMPHLKPFAVVSQCPPWSGGQGKRRSACNASSPETAMPCPVPKAKQP